MAILQSRLPAEGEFVFPGRYEGHINEPRAVLAHLRKEMGWNWIIHDLRRSCLSAGEKAGVPFLALQKIANHAVTREVTERYLVLDLEFIRPHMEAISQRLLELMKTSIEEWEQLDAFNVKPAPVAGLEQPAKLIEMADNDLASVRNCGLNIKGNAKSLLEEPAKLDLSASLNSNIVILEEEAEEFYW